MIADQSSAVRPPLSMKRNLVGPGTFRFLLSLIVVIGHFTRFNFGTSAVLLFFFLSGYWIERMWVSRYSRAKSPYLLFLVSRAWRLLPIFLVCSAAALLVVCGPFRDSGVPPIGLGLAISSAFIVGYNSIDLRPLFTAWSLDIELQYYAIAPFLSRIIAPRPNGWPLLFLAIILSIASLIISGRDDVLAYLPFFVGGMLAARSQLAVSTQLASIFGLVVAIYFVGSSLITYNIFSLGGELFSHKAGLPPLNQIILALLASPVALWTVRRPSTGFDKVLADQSYIVYLVHAVAVDILTRFVPTYANDDYLSRLIIAAVTIFLVGLCCHLLWKFVDEPSNRARHRFVQARMALQ